MPSLQHIMPVSATQCIVLFRHRMRCDNPSWGDTMTNGSARAHVVVSTLPTSYTALSTCSVGPCTLACIHKHSPASVHCSSRPTRHATPKYRTQSFTTARLPTPDQAHAVRPAHAASRPPPSQSFNVGCVCTQDVSATKNAAVRNPHVSITTTLPCHC